MKEPNLDIDQTPVDAPEPEPAKESTGADASETLTLDPPKPVVAVPARDAMEAVKLDPEQAKNLDEKVSAYLDAITKLDTHDPAFTARVNDITKLGDADIRSAANVSNRLLEKPMAALKEGGVSQAGHITKSLTSLRRTVEDLDPQNQGGDLLSPRKLFGVIPRGDRVVEYFRKYQSSQTHINAIIVSLYDGQDELRRDNVDIDQEKQNLWATMGRLRQYAYLAAQLDTALTRKIAEIEATDPDRAKVLKDDLLFPVRQKRQDLLTQLAVAVQGYLALDLIRRNNLELVKGVDRATTTTVSALRTAVIAAQALADQRLVLDQISALNETTGTLIESTSEMLRQQSTEVGQQAASSTVGLEKLQKSFQNIYATMDEIDMFKIKALSNLEQTITALEAEIEKSQAYVNRARALEGSEREGSALEASTLESSMPMGSTPVPTRE